MIVPLNKFASQDTEVGTINATKITNIIEKLGNQIIIPLLNKYAKVGWPVPVVYGVELINSEIVLGSDYILVGTDVDYEPQQLGTVQEDMSEDVTQKVSHHVHF